MPMSPIGKLEAGFTLIEILAVLALVGLLSALTFPEFLRWQDRIEMNQIWRLIQSDLNHLREEAIVEHHSGVLAFKRHGYDLQMGERHIERIFNRFNVILGVEEVERGELNENETESEESQSAATNTEIRFEPMGRCVPKQFEWETSHYRGAFQVTSDGMVSWTYDPK